MEKLRGIEKELNKYLKEQCAHFGCKVSRRSFHYLLRIMFISLQIHVLIQVNYFGSDKKRYQLEVPESAIKRANSKYELVGQRKGFKRYVTEETKVNFYTIMLIILNSES